jgi:hypothetical protein
LPAIDMTGWSPVTVERFKSLFNIDALSGEIAESGPDGESEDARASRLMANARVLNANYVQIVHQALTVFAFSGYREWHAYDDDDWTKNCLGQTLSEDQSGYIVSVLHEPTPAGLASVVQTMAGQFVTAWREQAQSDATAAGAVSQPGEEHVGLNAVLNDANWEYSRTPGTRYYIYRSDQYLFSDDPNTGLGEWATSQAREEAAKDNATEWAPGIFYTPYANPSLVEGIPRVYGLSQYGPWTLTEEEAQARAYAQAQAASVPGPEPAEIDIDALARESVAEALARLDAEPESPEALEEAIALVASALRSRR